MKLLFKTTYDQEAYVFLGEAQKQYGCSAIYLFRYRSNDGNFYYEVLLNEIELSFRA